MRKVSLLGCFFGAMSAVACGSLGDVNERAPLAVIEGQLTSQSATASSSADVRISVVWVGATAKSYTTAQDIRATPVFPSKFRLELSDPPPDAVMVTAANSPKQKEQPMPPSESGMSPSSIGVKLHDDAFEFEDYDRYPKDFRIAVGSVVAYEDKNGNGKLDLVDEDADSAVDKVLGVNTRVLLVYIEGTIPEKLRDEAGNLPHAGYNLLALPSWLTEEKPSDEPADARSRDGGWFTSGTVLELPLTANPRFSTYMCKNGGGESVGSEQGIPDEDNGVFPPAPGPDGWPLAGDEVYCSADRTVYYVSKCTTRSKGLCKGTITSCTTTGYSLPAGAVPPEWPCSDPASDH